MSAPQDGQRTTAKQLYAKLESTRKVYTDRAEKCAELTIPMAFPKESDTSSTKYETPYQSIGARGVNNLTSKLMLALFPPNAPFFRLSLGDEVRTQLGDDPATVQEWESALSKIERQITNYMESHQMRVTMNEAMTQLILAGNVLLFLPPKEGGMKLYRLNSYCLSRDGIGNTTEIVTKESIAYGALPPEAQRCIEGDNIEPHKAYDVYTHTYLDGEVYRSYQEVGDNIIPGTEQTYPKDASPWIPLRLRKMDGESYGRSFVDEYLGDLKAHEALSKSVTEIATIASNIIFLVNPHAQTRISELHKAQPGELVS